MKITILLTNFILTSAIYSFGQTHNEICLQDYEAAKELCEQQYEFDKDACLAQLQAATDACNAAYEAEVSACVSDPYDPEVYFECKAAAQTNKVSCISAANTDYQNCLAIADAAHQACLTAAYQVYLACLCTEVNLYPDNDGDVYGADNVPPILACPEDYPDYVQDNTDCNDNDALVNPGMQESCFTPYDDNCNNDDNDPNAIGCTYFYADIDGDGYGDPNKFRCLCYPEGDYNTTDNTDCKDLDVTIHPGAPEICDGKDNNCDGVFEAAPILVAKTKADYKCNDTAFYYLKGNLSNISAFVWGVSTGLTIIAGQGTPGIYVKFSHQALSDNTPDIIAYTYFHCAGVVQASFSVNPNVQVPSAAETIKGPGKVCPNDEKSFSVSSVVNACTYTWTPPSGAFITSGQGTKSIMIQFSSSFTGGSVSVVAHNTAGNGPATSKTISKINNCLIKTSESIVVTRSEPSQMLVFPNPTDGSFVINLISNEVDGIATVHVTNVLGQTIQSEKVSMNNNGQLSINVSLAPSLPQGIYFVRLILNDKMYYRQILYQK